MVRAIHADPESAAEQVRVFRALLKRANRALELLSDGGADAYEKALDALDSSTREWWDETVEETEEEFEPMYSAIADDLAIWVETEAMVYFQGQLRALMNRDVIREQAFGDAFDPGRFEQLARYETHIDRKFERTVAMLVKLQELRCDRDARALLASTIGDALNGSSDIG